MGPWEGVPCQVPAALGTDGCPTYQRSARFHLLISDVLLCPFQIFDNEAKDLEREVCFIDIACDEIPERYYKESEVSDGKGSNSVHSLVHSFIHSTVIDEALLS